VAAAVLAHETFISGEVLAESVSYGDFGEDAFGGEVGDGVSVRVAVRRAADRR
jgi:isoleucyl-tRNA synthetase